MIGRTSPLLSRYILQIVGICLGLHEDFANITHVVSRSRAYEEAFFRHFREQITIKSRPGMLETFARIPAPPKKKKKKKKKKICRTKNNSREQLTTLPNPRAFLANFWSIKYELNVGLCHFCDIRILRESYSVPVKTHL